MKNRLNKIIFLSILCIFLSLLNNCNARSYPLKEITLSNCKENCTIELPKISNASYLTYKNSALYRKVYSMLRLSTYYGGRDIGAGTHQGIDMACIIGTPVYATHEGIVTVAGTRGNRGNTITIKHERNGKIYYSVYAHLSKIDVQIGDIVEEGEKIGEVGDSGNTTGPHLHFQIDVNEGGNHPYFPSGCGDSIEEKVNAGICISDVKKNTTDPIIFLEQTTKYTSSKNTSDSDNIYITSENISIKGFSGGFLETNTLTQITISNTNQGTNILYQPITISGNSNYFIISPSSIQALAGERTIFLKTKNMTGLSYIEIKYGTKNLKKIPVLIGTKEDIEKRRSNKKLIAVLSKLGIE